MMPRSSICLPYMFKSVLLKNGSEQIPYSKADSPLADPIWFGIVEIRAVDCCSG